MDDGSNAGSHEDSNIGSASGSYGGSTASSTAGSEAAAPSPAPNSRMRMLAVAATAVALLAIAIPFVWQPHVEAEPSAASAPADVTPAASHASAADGAACMANAKPANFDFTMKDVDGNQVSLASYKGKVVLLNFWATWCGPCKAEIPALIELADKYRDKHLTVLGVSVDDSPEDLTQFAAEFRINYPILVGLGQDEFQEKYDAVMLIPVTWFIRPDGTVLKKHQGPATKDWFESQVKALLSPSARPEAN